jgi:hypothetical protein
MHLPYEQAVMPIVSTILKSTSSLKPSLGTCPFHSAINVNSPWLSSTYTMPPTENLNAVVTQLFTEITDQGFENNCGRGGD